MGRLGNAGFTVVGTGNADGETPTTVVGCPEGVAEQAELLASRLLPDAITEPDERGHPGC